MFNRLNSLNMNEYNHMPRKTIKILYFFQEIHNYIYNDNEQ